MLFGSLISIAAAVAVLLFPGEKGEDYAAIYFRCDRSEYEATYLENREAVASLAQLLQDAGTERIESVSVIAYASPEGPLKRNLALSQARAAALGPLVAEYMPDYASLITVEAGGEAWDPLRRRIVQDTLISEASRSRILRILDDNGVGPDTKKWRLTHRLGQDPAVGDLYRYILKAHYRYLRCLFVTIRYKDAEEAGQTGQTGQTGEAGQTTLPPTPLQPENETETQQPENGQPETTETETETETTTDTETEPETDQPKERYPLFAASTNLLYDVLITPNFALELPIGHNWSVLLDYTFPWWVNPANNRAWEMLKLDLGVRYWLGHRDASDRMDILRGHFIGLDLGAGYYDLEPRHTGWQGEFQTAGLEYGYAWRLGEKWRLDAFGAVGVFRTHYRYYEGNSDDSKLLWQYNGRYSWFGPTKLGVSIKYIFTAERARRGDQ